MLLKMKRYLFLILLCLSTYCSFGTDLPVVELTQIEEVIELEDSIFLAVAKGAETIDEGVTLRQIISELSFKSIVDREGEIEKDQSYWGAFRLINKVADGRNHEIWVMEFSSMNSHIEVFVVAADDHLDKSVTGSFVPIKEHTFSPKSGTNTVKLRVPQGEQVEVYFKVRNERFNHAPNFNIELSELTTFIGKNYEQATIDGVYIGFALMLLLYNLFLNIKVKKRSYLYYSVYVLGIVIFTGYHSGYLADAISFTPFAKFPTTIQFFKFSIYFSLVFYIAFNRRFLRLKRCMPVWNKRLRNLAILALPLLGLEIYLIVSSNYSYYPSDYCNMGYALIFVVVSFCFAVDLLRRKDIPGALYIAIGTFCMGGGILITAVLRLQELGYSLLSFQVASICEFLWFSVGLADARMKAQEEKQANALELEKNKLKFEQERQRALDQEQLMERLKRFYNNLTHEFKTPISIIKGNAGLKELGRENKQKIIHNADVLSKLVQDQLGLLKLDTTKVRIASVEVDLIKTLREWIANFDTEVKAKKQNLSLDQKKESLLISTDPEHLYRIVNNLIGNAIKFTPENGEISIKVREKDDKVQIDVIDNGIGISKENQERIFEREFQVDTPLKLEGSGLGLAIVKEFTQFINGLITIDSTIDEGSKFTLVLPKMLNIEVVERPIISNQPISELESEESERIRTIEKEVIDHQLDTLLVIEDNEDIAEVYQEMFKKKFNVLIAKDGVEGYNKAVEHIPNFILCDVMMPKMDGFTVCEKLRGNPATNHIPIIMITAKSAETDRIKGYRNGVDNYITKPFNNEQLIIIVDNLQKRQHALINRFQEKVFGQATSKNLSDSEVDEVDDIFKLEDQFIKDLIVVIEGNISNSKFKASDIATALYLSHDKLRKKLRNISGYTIPEFVRNYKIFKAKKLLLTTNKQVREICYEVGFTSPAVFTRDFKRSVGMTPKQFRENSQV